MSSDGHDGDGNGEHGVEHQRVAVLTLTYNHETCLVTIGGTAMPIALAQMIAGEGMRLLEEQRRVAAAAAFQRQVQESARVQQIVDRVRGGR